MSCCFRGRRHSSSAAGLLCGHSHDWLRRPSRCCSFLDRRLVYLTAILPGTLTTSCLLMSFPDRLMRLYLGRSGKLPSLDLAGKVFCWHGMSTVRRISRWSVGIGRVRRPTNVRSRICGRHSRFLFLTRRRHILVVSGGYRGRGIGRDWRRFERGRCPQRLAR